MVLATLTLCLFFNSASQAQTEWTCAQLPGSEDPDPNRDLAICGSPFDYTPDDYTYQHAVKLNFHFMLDGNGGGNYSATGVNDGSSFNGQDYVDREAERDRTVWYFNQLQALETHNRSVMQLTAGELAQWQAFAETANDIPGNWVGNVLCFGYKICVERAGSAGGANKSLRPRNADAVTEVVPSLSVAPNPATSWATFTHALTTEPSNAHVRIVDASGREVANLPFNAAQGQLLWDTREVPAGLYTVELYSAGARLATERLVIQPAK